MQQKMQDESTTVKDIRLVHAYIENKKGKSSTEEYKHMFCVNDP